MTGQKIRVKRKGRRLVESDARECTVARFLPERDVCGVSLR
jgi:hypothetical protein